MDLYIFPDLGEAEAILARANATAESIRRISKAIGENGVNGQDAISLSVAEKYVDAFGNLAKEGTTVIVPANANDMVGMVGSMMGVFEGLKKGRSSSK